MKLLRFLLFPFAVLYDLVTTIRNKCFDAGILTSTSFDIPVIAVGNLSVGGTGKTPQIEYLIKLLANDYKIAVLSRGYKRKTKGFIQLNATHTAEDVGDEPLQFFKKFADNITVAVDSDRTNGIKQLLQSNNPPEIVLLDDAYQHRKVKASFHIVLTKYNDLYTDDFLLPTGNLRESRRGAKRADVVVVTKCPENLSESEQNVIRKKLKLQQHQQLFFSAILYNASLQGKNKMSVNDLKEHEVVLVTGIANPTPMLDFLDAKNVKYQHVKFADHHNFTEGDIAQINEVFDAISAEKKIILTTEKDYVRLVNKLENISYLPINTSFLKDENLFNDTIINHIKS